MKHLVETLKVSISNANKFKLIKDLKFGDMIYSFCWISKDVNLVDKYFCTKNPRFEVLEGGYENDFVVVKDKQYFKKTIISYSTSAERQQELLKKILLNKKC